jgi:hypothetical protein
VEVDIEVGLSTRFRILGMLFEVDVPKLRGMALTGVLSWLEGCSSLFGRCLEEELDTIGEPASSTVTTLVESEDRP